jgi:hypothetical protein
MQRKIGIHHGNLKLILDRTGYYSAQNVFRAPWLVYDGVWFITRRRRGRRSPSPCFHPLFRSDFP